MILLGFTMQTCNKYASVSHKMLDLCMDTFLDGYLYIKVSGNGLKAGLLHGDPARGGKCMGDGVDPVHCKVGVVDLHLLHWEHHLHNKTQTVISYDY